MNDETRAARDRLAQYASPDHAPTVRTGPASTLVEAAVNRVWKTLAPDLELVLAALDEHEAIAGHALRALQAAAEGEPVTDSVIPFRAKRADPDRDEDLCACGAPAALSVGYQGESAPVLQCIACATEDRRTPFFHRKLDGCKL